MLFSTCHIYYMVFVVLVSKNSTSNPPKYRRTYGCNMQRLERI